MTFFKPQNIIPGIILLAVFALIALRAAVMDVTNDEAYSFYIMKHFWYAEALCTGNTHWLNSAVIKVMLWLRLENPLAIRSLSLLSAAIYLLVVFKIAKTFNARFAWMACVLLCCHPYINEYFSLARGYASGLALQILSIYLLSRLHGKTVSYGLITLAIAAASVSSNFSFIYFFVPFCTVYFFLKYSARKNDSQRGNTILAEVLIVFLTLAYFVLSFRFIMRCSADVVGAGSPDAWGLISSVCRGFNTYGLAVPSWLQITLSAIICGAILIASIYGLVKRKHHQCRIYSITSVLFLLMLAEIIVARFFNGVYPASRSSIFLFPCAALNLVFCLSFVSENKKSLAAGIAILTVLLGLTFFVSFRYNWVADYPETRDAESCFDELKLLDAKNTGMCPEMYSVFSNYYSRLNDSTYRYKSEWLNTCIPTGWKALPATLANYDYVLLLPQSSLIYYSGDKTRLTPVKKFEASGATIYKVEK